MYYTSCLGVGLTWSHLPDSVTEPLEERREIEPLEPEREGEEKR